MKNWIDYFRAVRGRIVWDRALIHSGLTVLNLQIRGRLRRPYRTGSLAFYPQPAGPWYTLPLVLLHTGIRTVSDPAQADAVMMFDDRTQSDLDRPQTTARLLNAHISDVSKAHVGALFESVFGYPLTLDPLTHAGLMVEKSDLNGVHDGRIVEGPLDEPQPGMIYQKLVGSTVRKGVTEDLRCICVAGEVIVVLRKEKATDARFSTTYLETTHRAPETCLSEAERTLISTFLNRIGLDFGSIDVLRDHEGDGRIYIVDVNKTCMPVLSMPAAELNVALRIVGEAVERLIRSA